MRYLLQKQSKEQLIDTVIDLMEVKALLEYDVDLYRDWYKREQSQESYTRALLREQQAKKLKLYDALREIAEEVNKNDEIDSPVVDDALASVFKLEKFEFTNEFTNQFMEVGKKYIKEHEDGREEREALKAKLKGTYSYQDEKRRERFKSNGK